MMLLSAYWLLSLFKPVSKYKILYLTRFSKMSRNVLCSCWKQPLPHCGLQMSYNSLTSNGYEQMCTPLTLISNQAHLLTTADAVKTVQFNVNGTDPYMAMVYLHIDLLQLWLLMHHRSVYSTSWIVCSNAIESYSDVFCLEQNLLHSLFWDVALKVANIALLRSQLPQWRETLIVLTGKTLEQLSPTFPESRSPS